jgi:hypothetical protein
MFQLLLDLVETLNGITINSQTWLLHLWVYKKKDKIDTLAEILIVYFHCILKFTDFQSN